MKHLLLILIFSGIFFAADLDKYNLDPDDSYIYISRSGDGEENFYSWDVKESILIKGKLKKEVPNYYLKADYDVAVYILDDATVIWNLDDKSSEEFTGTGVKTASGIDWIKPPCGMTKTTQDSGTKKLEELDSFTELVGGKMTTFRISETRESGGGGGSYKWTGRFLLVVRERQEYLPPAYTTAKSSYYYEINTGFILNPTLNYETNCKNDAPYSKVQNLEYYFAPLSNATALGVDTINGSLLLSPFNDYSIPKEAIGNNFLTYQLREPDGYTPVGNKMIKFNTQWRLVLPENIKASAPSGSDATGSNGGDDLGTSGTDGGAGTTGNNDGGRDTQSGGQGSGCIFETCSVNVIAEPTDNNEGGIEVTDSSGNSVPNVEVKVIDPVGSSTSYYTDGNGQAVINFKAGPGEYKIIIANKELKKIKIEPKAGDIEKKPTTFLEDENTRNMLIIVIVVIILVALYMKSRKSSAQVPPS
ncbi:carboxypeptidase regulatory-like domain-containing protein [Candidatus Micrarchaeota archaeon]|nr:carboxypeptidase regulatory-like domain-containing protein [Candidatus Micrarchaeota archaeon]